jgi:hypothetical protein
MLLSNNFGERMTTFTTEDREWAFWHTYDTPKYSRQVEIPFFWPLTEQMELDLEYGPTHLHYRAQGIAGVSSMPIQGSIYEYTTVTMAPNTTTLSVNPQNSVGQLNIGGISVGLENEPKWYQKVMYKLLGFDWKK